jgi:hypothetical protein
VIYGVELRQQTDNTTDFICSLFRDHSRNKVQQ